MSFNPAVTNTGTASSGALQFTPGYMGSAPMARNMAPKLADFLIVGATAPAASTGYTTAGAELDSVSGLVALAASGPAAQFGLVSGPGALLNFRTSGVIVGSISTTGASVAYNTTCDYRVKEIEGRYHGALAALAKLPVWAGGFRGRLDRARPMLLAHEVQATAPETVMGTKDAVDAGGLPVMQLADLSKLTPYLVAAAQEIAGRIVRLESAERVITRARAGIEDDGERIGDDNNGRHRMGE